MAQVAVYGAINIDRLCSVDCIAPPGATIISSGSVLSAGGKGANQAAACALAGAPTTLVGCIGADGDDVLREIASCGVDVSRVARTNTPTGTAFIQVAPDGENSIVIDGGANRTLDADAVHRRLTEVITPGDILLVQNEASGLAGAIRAGIDAGIRVWLNATPIEKSLGELPLEQLDALIVNETEARALVESDDPLSTLAARAPTTLVILTRGSRGGEALLGPERFEWDAEPVAAVDTVGCGDAFIGVLAASTLAGLDLVMALKRAARAAALTAMAPGSIPALPSSERIDA